MINDDTIPNILEIKSISPSSSSKDLAINTSEDRASNSTDSSGSSPSDLRKRLEDLPSPNEFTLLADRVAALGRQIFRKRESFLRLYGLANRIEEHDEWEEREQKAEFESSLGASRLKDARARRRARVRLESSPLHDNREITTMVISQAGCSTGPSKITGDDDKLKTAELSIDRSATRNDRLRLPEIAVSRRQARSSSLSEPSTTRFLRHSNGESCDIKCKTTSHSYRNFTSRNSASKPADLPSVSPFSLSSVRPTKFGGYRPPSGVLLKNLSSESESESVNEASRGFSSVRKNVGDTVASLELSSPESTAVSTVHHEPVKKMPIMSARSDIVGSILPNLLPSSRSLDNDNFDHRIAENTSRSCVGQINHDGAEACNELGRANTLAKGIFNERAGRDGFVGETSSELRQVGSEYEDTRYRKQETPRVTSTFFARSFTSESPELATSIYNKWMTGDETKGRFNEFKRIGSEFEGIQNEREKVGDYRCIASKIHCDDIKDQFESNCPTGRSNFEANSFENNGDVLDIADWNRSTSFYTEEAADTLRHCVERIQNDVKEEALSSQTSEPYGCEDHSRSSCTTKMYLRKETLSGRRSQDGVDTPDKCDREIMTKVPTLALNSQDISYSSAGSREYSATRPLDPHALIKALSDVSLKQEKQSKDVSRNREGFYHSKDTVDASSAVSSFPTKGETWRVPRSSTESESPGKSLSRVPSRIPVRISDSRIMSPGNKFSDCYKPEDSSEIAIYADSKFIGQNGVPCETLVRQINSQICERDSSKGLRSANGSVEVTIAEGVFAPDSETAEYEIDDRAHGSLTSSNPRTPQSTPFNDYTYDKIHLSKSKIKGQSCSPMFFHKAAYPGTQHYAMIDDDVRSKSDRSTSRKSGDTVDVITSATESPGLSKYKKESSRIESLRNVEENVTWRTEDECASINDEENPENEDYMSRDEKPQCLRENGRYKLARENVCEPLPFRTQQPQLNSSSKIQKGGRKRHADDDLEFSNDKLSSFDQNFESTRLAQSGNLTFQIHRTRELSNCTVSSTLNLDCEPKRKKKKSQERFPFTISEASGALSSAKHKDTSDCQSFNKNLDRTKMDNQQEQTVYQLKKHPSLTRLATSATEDTVADILCCLAQEKEHAMSSKSKLKTLVRIFSSKLRKVPKQPSVNETPEPAKLIYENSACQADSRANSCSNDSSTDETHKTYSNNRLTENHIVRTKPVSSQETLKKTESSYAQEYPRRRYDRDDLWVRDIKNSSPNEKKDIETLQRKDETDVSKESPPKDRYSIFLAKNPKSDKTSVSNRDNSPKEHHDVIISDHAMLSDGKDKQSIDPLIISNFISGNEEIEEDLTGCLCWRLCQIIAPLKYRSPVKSHVPVSRTKKSDSLLRKRKK